MFRKRYYYRGAIYAKNYNGENEARVKNADGTFTTKHVGFNQFEIAAEKLFKKDTISVEYNGKTYKYDDNFIGGYAPCGCRFHYVECEPSAHAVCKALLKGRYKKCTSKMR